MPARSRGAADVLHGFWTLGHPGPVGLWLTAVLLFAVRASWPNPPWVTIGLLLGGQAAMQLSIGMLNDYCDRDLDAAGGRNKPIARGQVHPREALLAGLVMIVLMFAILLPTSRAALLVAVAYLLLGQLYNLGLKSTPVSGILFALATPLIPIYSFAGVGDMPAMAVWFLPIGALLGVAVNLANSLPDIEDDAAAGARTLAVTLGLQGSYRACNLLIALAAALIGVLIFSGVVAAQLRLVLPLLALTGVGLASMALYFGPEKPRGTRTLYFYLVAVLSLLLGGGWFIAVNL